MGNIGTAALIAQALVTVVGGLYALFRYAQRSGATEERLNRIIRQVEPNNGSSLRDDVLRLSDEFRGLRDEQRRESRAIKTRLDRLERK